ncbi:MULTISPECIES: hypothetical protein [unclassified Thioalkalivibrio]|uniref:hypothetical protein n=1 Tax=unclassified Thioalkalivibrio TaxID=2621013 RepID=UPI0003707653|nr:MULTISPECIES: hypothetical protein [unclassified Thioalkalivibrio]
MARLTISLDDQVHQALKEAAARQRRSIASIVEESLVYRGIKTHVDARGLVDAARKKAGLSEEDALAIAVDETRKTRQR